MTVPPEVYGCLSVSAGYERRQKEAWRKGNEYRRQKFRRKCQEKIDRLTARAVRLLAKRGLTVDALAA